MKKYFIDTNIFLRVLIKEDKKTFRSCYQFLQAVKTNKVKASTASIVIAETAWTLRSYYKFPKTKVVQAIRGILSLRGLRIIDSYDSLWAIEKFSRYNVKYIDTLIASILEKQKSEWIVVSYDKDFDKLGIERKEPKQINKS